MGFTRIFILLSVILSCTNVFAAGEAAPDIRTSRQGATVAVDRVIKEGTLVISVSDAAKEPQLGLGATDFTVTQAGRTANIKSVQPISETLEVPRHFVLVLDNSSSMKQRDAVKPLLAGVDELLKIVRPIDEVQIVFFDDEKTMKIGGRDLHVRTFKSSNPAELKEYAATTYRDGMTNNTVLFEGMLAGLELVSAMPAAEPRFMVVFSDGEDINSAFKKEVVSEAARGVGRFNAFTIDYMPGNENNRFLASFAADNNGQLWKATSETNLVSIFQSVASKMQYYYVISYLFPPTGSLSVSPERLAISQLRSPDAPLSTSIDSSELTLKPVIDTAYGIERWKVAVTNSKGIVTEQAGEGTPSSGMKLSLPTGDLQPLIDGGDLALKMEIQDKSGQNLELSAAVPVSVKVSQAQGQLSVSKPSVTIDIVRSMDQITSTAIDSPELILNPSIDSPGWIARWKAVVSNSKGVVGEQAGIGAPGQEIRIPLPIVELPAFATAGDLTVTMELLNLTGQKLALTAIPVKMVIRETAAKLTVEPASFTIEEIKTIDASPMLGQIFFDKGLSEIPSQYVRLKDSGETAGFDEQKFGDTLEKYYQVLNIVGRRLTEKQDVIVTLVGCNDNTGAEKGKTKLSAERAAAVKTYLQTIWGIAPERMTIESRNLSKIASTTRSKEGQAENRRVEIIASDPSILTPIRSTYFTTRIDTPALTVRPNVAAPNGIAEWKITAKNSSGNVAELSGKEAPAKENKITLDPKNLKALGTAGDISVAMELQDKKGQKMLLNPAPVKVNFVETSKRLAQKLDQKVQEKYALILFDFDKDTISASNQGLVTKIVTRFKELPQATMAIEGHTDNIGKEAYNIKLSERRAAAVNKMISAAYGEPAGDRIRFSGVGPNSPLFDNQTPEGRSFNRTVTITLEYVSQE